MFVGLHSYQFTQLRTLRLCHVAATQIFRGTHVHYPPSSPDSLITLRSFPLPNDNTKQTAHNILAATASKLSKHLLARL